VLGNKVSNNIMFSGNELEEEKKYWKTKLTSDVEITSFSIDYENNKFKKAKYSEKVIDIPKECSNEVIKIANNSEYALYMILTATVNYLVHRYTSKKDIVIGMPPFKEYDLNNFTNNYLALKNSIDEKKSFKDLLQQVKKTIMEADKYHNLPFFILKESMTISNQMGEEKLFNISVLLENIHSIKDIYKTSSQVIFMFNLDKDKLKLKVIYNSNIFREETIEVMGDCLINIFNAISKDHNILLKDIEILSPKEKNKILVDFNGKECSFDNTITIAKKFEKMVDLKPNNIALKFEDEKSNNIEREIKYKELNCRANQFARYLRSKGVKTGEIVAVMMESSYEFIVSILGILKAGAAYLPIDPVNYPNNRVVNVIKDSKSKMLVTKSNIINEVKDGIIDILKDEVLDDFEVIIFEDIEKEISILPKENLGCSKDPNDIAYIIYTSGTTGKPKGVLIKNIGVNNLVAEFKEALEIEDEDIFLQFASCSFDASVVEIFTTLLNGITLYLPDKARKYLKDINNFLVDKRISLAILSPTILKNINSSNIGRLRVLVSAGEKCTENILDNWRNKVNFINAYGPTEGTVCATFRKYSKSEKKSKVTIGYPLRNTYIYVLDENLRVLPIGVPGELYISGVNISAGYLNNREMTEKLFVKNPFIEGKYMYKTGDLVRFLPSGEIEYLDRIDKQVKVRGCRVEIGEIESKILKYEGIKSVVLLDRKDNRGNTVLDAYYTSDVSIKTNMLREYLLKELPGYMVPSSFIQVDNFPLNLSGKVDRNKLQLIDNNSAKKVIIQPKTKLQSLLVSIWKSVLELEEISIGDNFFEIGGNSFKIIEIISMMAEKGYELNIYDLLKNQTVIELENYLKNKIGKKVITTKDELEKRISDDFNIANELVVYNVSKNKYSILYIERENVKEKIIQAIKKYNINKDVIPDYICSISEKIDSTDLSEAQLEELIGARGYFNRNNIQSIVEKKVLDFSKQITSANIIDEYDIAPIQKYHLENNQHSGIIFEIDRCLDIDDMNKTIGVLVNENNLLRSILINNDKGYVWREFDFVGNIELPLIDISNYRISEKEKALTYISNYIFFKPYSITDELHYRMLLVKLNMKKYVMIMPASHIMFDAISKDIVIKKVMEIYDDIRSGKDIKRCTKNNLYKEYVNQIEQGPKEIKPEDIIYTFNLEKYVDYVEEFSDITKNMEIKHTAYEFRIDKKDFDQENLMGKLFALFKISFEKIFNSSKLPLSIVNYGRRYMSNTWYDTIGEFLDFIPMIFDENYNDCNIEQKINGIIKLSNVKNINFFRLMYEGVDGSYIKLKKLMRRVYNKPLIFFNFQGNFNEEDSGAYNKYLEVDNFSEKENSLNSYFAVQNYKEFIKIRIDLPFNFEINHLEQVFMNSMSELRRENKNE